MPGAFQFTHRVAKVTQRYFSKHWSKASRAEEPAPFQIVITVYLGDHPVWVCEGFLRVIGFLLLQKSTTSCTVWGGEIRQSHRVLISQTQTFDMPQRETVVFFSLSDHLWSSEGAISQRRNRRGCLPDQCPVYRG